MNDRIKFIENINSQIAVDIKTVKEMLRRARTVDLEAEVVLTFGECRLLEQNVSEAAWHACADHGI